MTGSGNSSDSSTIGCARVAERVAGAGVLEADAGDDVAGVDGVDVVLSVLACISRRRPTRSLLPRAGVEDLVALVERARVDPEVGELADVGVGHDLEGQGRERLLVVGLALELLVALEVHALDRRDVERRRQVVDDGVEQGLDALVLERGAVEHRDDLAGDGGLADGGAELVGGDLLLADELLEEVLVGWRRRSR